MRQLAQLQKKNQNQTTTNKKDQIHSRHSKETIEFSSCSVSNGDQKKLIVSTDLPSKGTDIDVEGIISAKSKKNTVNDSKMEMDNDTW